MDSIKLIEKQQELLRSISTDLQDLEATLKKSQETVLSLYDSLLNAFKND